ncbi:MAG: FtsB family cell division protein [Bacillota bacterium]
MSKKVLIIILVVLLIFMGTKFYRNAVRINELENEISNLNKDIENTREENDEMELMLENIDEDEFIEKMAREKLGLVKPGEILLIPVEKEEE